MKYNIDKIFLTLLDKIEQYGSICDYKLTEDEQKTLKELEELGLIIRCDKIPHSRQMINPSYTYVSNDDRGYRLAMSPLYTYIM